MNPSLLRRALPLVALTLVACGDASDPPASPPGPALSPTPDASPSPRPEDDDAGARSRGPEDGDAVPLADAFVRVSAAECTSGLTWLGSRVQAQLKAGKYQFSSCTLRLAPAAGVRDVAVSIASAPAAPEEDPWKVTQKPAGDELEITFARKDETFERTPMELRLDFSREGRKAHAALKLEPASPLELARFEAPRIVTTEELSETTDGVTTRVRRPFRVDANGVVVLRPREGLVVEMPYELMPGVTASVLSTMWDAAVWPAVPFERCLLGRIQQSPGGETALALMGRRPYAGAGVLQAEATDGLACNTAPLVGRELVTATLHARLLGFGYGLSSTARVSVRVVPEALDGEIALHRVAGGVALKNVADHTLVGLRASFEAPCEAGRAHVPGERPAPRDVGDVREQVALDPGSEIVWTAEEIRAALPPSCAGRDVTRIWVTEGWSGAGRTGWLELASLPSR